MKRNEEELRILGGLEFLDLFLSTYSEMEKEEEAWETVADAIDATLAQLEVDAEAEVRNDELRISAPDYL